MDEFVERDVAGQSDSADPVDDLDRLAVIEAELDEAEAELDAMDNAPVDQNPGSDL